MRMRAWRTTPSSCSLEITAFTWGNTRSTTNIPTLRYSQLSALTINICMLEVAHRAPMMLHVPGVIEQSMFTEKLVEFVDILPTLVEAAGLPTLDKCPEYSRDVPICREGTSLLRMVDGEFYIVSLRLQP